MICIHGFFAFLLWEWAFPSRLDIRSAACVSRVSATVHFWERGKTWADADGPTSEGGTIARMQTINEITVASVSSPLRSGGRETEAEAYLTYLSDLKDAPTTGLYTCGRMRT